MMAAKSKIPLRKSSMSSATSRHCWSPAARASLCEPACNQPLGLTSHPGRLTLSAFERITREPSCLIKTPRCSRRQPPAAPQPQFLWDFLCRLFKFIQNLPKRDRADFDTAARRRIKGRRVIDGVVRRQARTAVGGRIIDLERHGLQWRLVRLPEPAVAWIECNRVGLVCPIRV